MCGCGQPDDRLIELALALVEHRHDRALDDLLEVRRLAVRVERGLIGVVLVEQEQVGILGGSVGVIQRAAGLAGLDERRHARSAASTSSPWPAFTVYFATSTIIRFSSKSVRESPSASQGSLMIATARTGAADAPRHFTGSTLTVNE